MGTFANGRADDISDATRMIALSDDKDPAAPVLHMSRVEISKFFDGVIAGEFDSFRASAAELAEADVAA
ncbi:hypothetical protein [Streptomyces sp. NPDC005865]|uniref:hypothetical protein n=1 Tax=Streptomyces sp. NPDC005865 TaxID=3155453 RepID=UPI00340C36D8